MIRPMAFCVCTMLAGWSTAMADSSASTDPEGSVPSLSVCRTIKVSTNRLQCYDKLSSASISREKLTSLSQIVADEKVIVKWNGSSQMQTRPFRVEGPWELQWTAQKGYFSAILHRISGRGPEMAILANGMEGGSSSSYQPTGGEFYIEFGAMQSWNARAVSVPSTDNMKAQPIDEEPLLEVSGDQSGLPACDGQGASGQIKKLIEESSYGQTMHISVIHVGAISRKSIKDSMTICTAQMVTNGGETSYDFQFYRKDDNIYIYGKPHPG